MSFRPVNDGFVVAGQGGGGGHASLSDDGNGNIVVADGAGFVVSNGFAIDAPNSGIDFQSGILQLTVNGSARFHVEHANAQLVNGLRLIQGPSVDQSLTAAGDALTSTAGHLKVTATSVLTLTSEPTLPNGQDGELRTIENVGSNTFTLQDESTLGGSNIQSRDGSAISIAGGKLINLVYSTDVNAWTQPL